MTNKKRIMMCAESSHVNSGFGNYTREILSRLHATGKYEIAELSCYRSPEMPKKEPWKIYPAAPSHNDPNHKTYISNPINQFGYWRFELALLDFKPDIVFDIRDYWMFGYQELTPLRDFFYWILAPTYDSSPPRIEILNTFASADEVLFHTEWAKQDLIRYDLYNNINISKVVNDSVDPLVFRNIGKSKAFHKEQYGISHKAFVIGSVMRNQKRKLIADEFIVLSKLIKNNPDREILLYLHTSYPEAMGWDIPSLLLEHNVQNNVLFTYMCKQCGKHFPAKFQGPHSVCHACGGQTSIPNVGLAINQKDLSSIYNLFDIYLQYAICEGFGIPQVEAAACGIPLVTVDHGAMAEIAHNLNGEVVHVDAVFRELETNADRVYPDNNHCATLIQKYVDMGALELAKKGQQTRKLLLEKYSWDKTAKVFEEVFDAVNLTGLQGKWDIPLRQVNLAPNIPEIKEHRDFVYYIIDNVLYEPKLKKTFFAEEIIRNLNYGFVANNGGFAPYTRETAVKLLETYLNNKVNLDKFRTGEAKFPDDLNTFFNYK